MKITLIKNGGRLFAADADAEEALSKLPNGKELSAEITRMRNPAFHRKAMAMLRYSFQCWEPATIPAWRGQPVVKDFDRFRREITILAGYGDPVVSLRGEVRIEPRSISFASMDEDEFAKWYSAVIDTLLKVVFVGQDKAEVEKQIEQFMGYW